MMPCSSGRKSSSIGHGHVPAVAPRPGQPKTDRLSDWLAILVAATVLACGNGRNNGAEATDQAAEGSFSPDQSGDAGSADVSLPPPETLWPDGPHAPELPVLLTGSHPWLADLSTWSFLLDETGAKPHFRYLPDFAVGNGRTFSLLGYSYPLNTLHSMTGPHYDKEEGFFGDTWLEVVNAGSGLPLTWQQEWVGRVRSTPIVVSQAQGPAVRLTIVDFAPLTSDPEDPVSRALVRRIVVANRAQQGLKGLALAVRFTRSQQAAGAGLLEKRETRTRLTLVLGEATTDNASGSLTIDVGPLAAGEERAFLVAYVMDDDSGLMEKAKEALAAASPESLLDQTREAWLKRFEGTTRIETPDLRVNDYLDSQRVVVAVQQAANGSSQPMSEYTRFWLRDNSGSVRYFLTAGMYEDARRLLDALWIAILAEGDIKNTYAGNHVPEDALPQPDWDSKPTFTGRCRAEGPSFVPLMHAWYWKATGKADFIAERLAMMRCALEKQEFKDNLQYFSTDETYRTAMAIAHGLKIDEQFAEGFFSSYSSFLWVVGAESLAEMAEAVGNNEVAESLRTRADDVRAAADQTYLTADGWYLPYVYEKDLAPAPAPFEDVGTQPLWTGYLERDSTAAIENLEKTISLLGGEDGILVSSLPEGFDVPFEFPISEGLMTGMAPGYYLSNLAATVHPLAEAAFNAMARHGTAGGSSPEYQILDDFAPLHLAYDAQGEIGDYTARYRPWEGGINAAAVIEYLLGNVADGRTMELSLRPNLPNGWSWMKADGIRTGESRIDMTVTQTAGRTTVRLTHAGGPAVTVRLALPVASATDLPEVSAGGVLRAGTVELLPWGNALLHFAPFELAPAGAP
jgi:hypothetical protein